MYFKCIRATEWKVAVYVIGIYKIIPWDTFNIYFDEKLGLVSLIFIVYRS